MYIYFSSYFYKALKKYYRIITEKMCSEITCAHSLHCTYFNSRKLKGYRSVGISRTPRWNVWNGGHEWANHPLREALISNYLIKICLRRGASYAPFELVLRTFCLFQKTRSQWGSRVFEGSEVDLTSRRRYEGPKRKEVMHVRIYAKFTIRLDKDRREISAHLQKTFQSLVKNLFTVKIIFK